MPYQLNRCIGLRRQLDLDSKGESDGRRIERQKEIDLRNKQVEERVQGCIPGDVVRILRLRGGVSGIRSARKGREDLPGEFLTSPGGSTGPDH